MSTTNHKELDEDTRRALWDAACAGTLDEELRDSVQAFRESAEAAKKAAEAAEAYLAASEAL